MAHAAILPARRGVLFHQDAFTISMTATVFVAGLLFAGLWGASQLLDTGSVSVATTLSETAAMLEHHADSLGGDRVSDAATFRAVAQRLRRDSLLLGDQPGSNTYASASLLSAKADQLYADASALEARGSLIGDSTLVEVADRLRDAAAALNASAMQMRGMLRR